MVPSLTLRTVIPLGNFSPGFGTGVELVLIWYDTSCWCRTLTFFFRVRYHEREKIKE